MKFDSTIFLVLLASFAPLIALLLALAVDRYKRKRIEKPPQTEKLLRPPGHSLANLLDETADKITTDIFLACGVTTLAGASALSFAQSLAIGAPWLWRLLFGALLSVFTLAGILIALRAFRRLRQARNIRLGLRGEQAVAEALHEAADCGYRIFHDFPGGDNWNIDHIAVGTRGVFAIETKARSRRGSRNGQPEHELTYDNERIQFPTRTDKTSIGQAIRNAKWLSAYLTKKTGDDVEVCPLIAVPGWYAHPPKMNVPVRVMNASYLKEHLRGRDEHIDPKQVIRMITALEEKCRDVEF